MSTNAVELGIKFDNSRDLFLCGEPIKGEVEITAKEYLKSALLAVKLEGFYIFKNGNIFTKEEFLHIYKKLTINGSISAIKSGFYQCDFMFDLKDSNASSFESEIGSIRYIVSLISWFKMADDRVEKHDITKVISVNSLYNLNTTNKNFKDRSYVKFRSRRLCCIGSYLYACLNIEKRVFVPGESMNISCWISNYTNVIIPKTVISLIQIVVNKYKNKQKKAIIKKESGFVLKYKTVISVNERLKIPPIACTSPDINLLISYKIHLEINKSDGQTVKLKIPVIIGNIPLDDGPEAIQKVKQEDHLPKVGASGDTSVNMPLYIVYQFVTPFS